MIGVLLYKVLCMFNKELLLDDGIKAANKSFPGHLERRNMSHMQLRTLRTTGNIEDIKSRIWLEYRMGLPVGILYQVPARSIFLEGKVFSRISPGVVSKISSQVR